MTHLLDQPPAISVKPSIIESAAEAAARVCHEEQMTVWSGELFESLSVWRFFRTDLSYEDVATINTLISEEIRRIVECAFNHPELG